MSFEMRGILQAAAENRNRAAIMALRNPPRGRVVVGMRKRSSGICALGGRAVGAFMDAQPFRSWLQGIRGHRVAAGRVARDDEEGVGDGEVHYTRHAGWQEASRIDGS